MVGGLNALFRAGKMKGYCDLKTVDKMTITFCQYSTRFRLSKLSLQPKIKENWPLF